MDPRQRKQVYDTALVIAWVEGYQPSDLVGEQSARWPLYLEHARMCLQDINTDEIKPPLEGTT
jgi:hypothetical protein